MNLADNALKRPVTTIMVFTCFVVIGLISSRLVPLEYFPSLDAPFIGVDIPYPGSTPEEVERQITRPAEEVLATISDIKRMSSNSRENGTWIGLEFDWGIDANIKALEAREKLENIRDQFPDDMERFYVRKWSTSDWEMLTLRISSNRDLSNAYDMLDRNIQRRIERLDGVSRVNLYGIARKEIQIELHADKIIAHHVDLGQLSQILRNSNQLITAGKITDQNQRLVVRPIGEFQQIDEIGNIIIKQPNIRLQDVADVRYTHPELDYGRHLNRKYAIGLDVYKEAGANTVEVAEHVKDEIEVIKDLPEMAGIQIYFMNDQADGILSSLRELLKSGFLGGSLAILILFFFLRRIGSTLIVSLSVPFCLLVTLAFMYFTGISLNILTMMGLMLAVGMVVDNAVVVTESIHRYQMSGGTSQKTILKGVNEVAMAITAGTVTTAIVFLPNIVSANNEISIYIKHVALAFCIALGASLIMAQTVVPLLVSRLKPPKPSTKRTVVDQMADRYKKILGWTIRKRWASVGIILLVLLSVAIPMSVVKQEMFDEPEDRTIRLRYHINGQYLVEKVEAAVDVYEEYLFAHQDEFEIESVYSYYNTGYASSTILLKKGKGAKRSIKDIKDAIINGLPKLAIAAPSFERRNDRGGESVRIQLIGKSSQVLSDLSKDIAWTLEKIPGFKRVRSEAETGSEEIHVVVDRERAKQYGFSPLYVANVISAAMRGINLRRFRGPYGEILTRLEFQDSDRQNLEQLKNLPLFNNDEQPVKLSTLADFHVKRGPSRIRRESRTTAIGVRSDLQDITVDEAKEKIRKVLANYNFPAGYSWNYGERFDYEEEAFNTMLINLVMALALIYFVMAALFESLVFPGAIWTQIIFAVVGVYWFFFITGTTMSVMAMIGILILIGVVVNNGIVLIDHVKRLREMGLPRDEAILRAGSERMRPILMTAGTTVLSLVPLCIATTQIGGDGPPYFPMARAIVGGLTFSTMVTLLILPTIYILLDDYQNWGKRVIRMVKRS